MGANMTDQTSYVRELGVANIAIENLVVVRTGMGEQVLVQFEGPVAEFAGEGRWVLVLFHFLVRFHVLGGEWRIVGTDGSVEVRFMLVVGRGVFHHQV